MLQNYLLTAWRQIQKNKLHTTINIFGLAVGIAACLVILLTIIHEFSYDRHHPNSDRVYRITSITNYADDPFPIGGVPGPMPYAIRDEFTGLELVAAFHTVYSADVKISDGTLFEKQRELVIAEPEFFKIFSDRQWVSGNADASLSKPFQVVLTQSQARKYFGEKEPVGKTLVYFDSLDFTVSGIIADDPYLSDFDFTDYLSYATLQSNKELAGNNGFKNWHSLNSSSLAFVKLSTGISSEDIEAQFPDLIEKYMRREGDNTKRRFNLQPMADIHFNADYPLDNGRVAHKPTLYGLAIVALFLLLIASVNFINLETARGVLRAREVGVRKALGSSQRQLIRQFLGETFFITLIAGVLSLLIAYWGIQFFAESLPPNLTLKTMWDSNRWLILLAIILIVSVLAGAYPALVLSSFSPVAALKNQPIKMSGSSRRAYLRKSLIIFQFAIAQAFILGTLLIGSQLHYLLNKDMGFRKDAIISFQPANAWGDTTNRKEIMANELKNLSSVAALSLSDRLPASSGWSSRTVSYQKDTSKTDITIYQKNADTNYLDVYNMELLAGRNLNQENAENEILINETALKAFDFEFPADAIGQLIELSEERTVPIVGVIRDFHDGPLYDKIHPIMIGTTKSLNTFNVLMATRGKQGKDFKQDLSQIENIYHKFYPDEPFDFQFYDDTIAGFYKTEQRTAKLINVTTGLAILISCLGLLGLVSFTTNQRIKEIGIRKVLGANVAQIIALFSREFAVLVLLSFLIAAPLASYFANEWLQKFAYRIDINISLFLLTVVSALAMALLTVVLKSLKAALANPVDALRSE